MAEGIYRNPGRAVVDGDRFLVVGPRPGPAGVSGVELPDGSVWEVDHAEPSVPVLLEVDTVDPPASPLLVAAFGGDGALFLADDAVRMSVDDLEETRTVDNRPGENRYWSRRRPFANEPSWEAGNALLLADMGNDRRLYPLAQLAACLEFAVSADHTAVGIVLTPVLSGFLDTAEQLADEVDDHELASLDRWTVDGLRGVCLRARKVGRRLDPTLRTLLRRLEHITPAEPEIAVQAQRMQEPDLDLVRDEHLIASALAAPPPAAPTTTWPTSSPSSATTKWPSKNR